MNQKTTAPRPRRRRWPKVLFGFLGILVILLVAVYFIGTSEAFLKKFVLPRVSKSINADVTVESASLSPFSKVVLRGLKVQTTGSEPLVSAQEIRARYSLPQIIGGNIKVEEAVLVAAVVQVVKSPDGTSNLDPILQSQKKEKKDRGPSDKRSEPPRIDLSNLSLINATVRQINNLEGGRREVTEVSGVNLTVANLQNGQTGKATLSAKLKIDSTNGLLAAKTDGNFSFDLSADLKPQALKGGAQFHVEQATGAFAEVSGLGANLLADATPAQVRNLLLNFSRNNEALGEIRAEGPFDLAKTEGRLNLQVTSIDRRVLNLIGAKMGLDFAKTAINSSNQVELAKAGSVITIVGNFNAAQFSLARTNQTTPPVDFAATYNVTVDRPGKAARLQNVSIVGVQQKKELLRVETPTPMNIVWGENVVPTGDSALNLAVTDLNLADWAPVFGAPLKAGTVNMAAKITSQESGKQLRLDVTSRVEGATASFGSNEIKNASVFAGLRGTLSDLLRLKISGLNVQTIHNGQPVATLTGSGEYDDQSGSSDFQLSAEAVIPQALQMVPQADLNSSSGTLTFNGRVFGGQKSQTITGTMALANFTGKLRENSFEKYGAAAILNVERGEKLVEIRQLATTLTKDNQPGGKMDVSGRYDVETKAAQASVKLAGLNEKGLEPFLAPLFKDKKLISLLLNGNADLNYNSAGASSVRSDVQLAKLVVSDPQKKIPATPLEARLQLDSSLDKQVLDLKQARLGLTSTTRAKNEVDVTGRIDMSRTNALEGAINVKAESLDLTSYYDLFAGKEEPAPVAAPRESAASAPAPAKPPTEPKPVTLPVKKLATDINIGRLYLREVEVADFKVAPQVESTRVRTGPMELMVNGAPMKMDADINLAVPGYGYNLSFVADKVPLEPLVNTFMPEKRGKYKGTLVANTQVKGAGITGHSLKQHLASQIQLNLTNANIAIGESRLLKVVIGAAAMVLKTPELTESPLDYVTFESKAGNGQIQVGAARVTSPLLIIDTGGTITLADVLTNSVFESWPIKLQIRRSLAEKTPGLRSIIPTGTGEFVPLPTFVKLTGTIGNPGRDIDEKALLGIGLNVVADNLDKLGVDPKMKGVVEGIGGIISGRRPAAATNTPPNVNTNAPATNQPPKFNPLEELLKRRPK